MTDPDREEHGRSPDQRPAPTRRDERSCCEDAQEARADEHDDRSNPGHDRHRPEAADRERGPEDGSQRGAGARTA